MLIRLGVGVVALLTVGCSGGGESDELASCDAVWVEGADVSVIADQPCGVDGEPTYFTGSASLDCNGGGSVHFNDFGYWLDDEMVLHTDWNSAGDYTMADVEAACDG